MSKSLRLLMIASLVTAVAAGCKNEKGEVSEYESGAAQPAFAFTVYPGAKYLAQLTDLTKQAHKVVVPNEKEPPAMAIYDSEAPIEQVAEWYAKSYGFNTVAPDATNNLSAAKPPAFYRSGDLNADLVSIKPVLDKMNLKVDIAKAQGKYKGANIDPRPNRPRVTLERPYFDVTTQQVVDRTLILMARE
ncbi:MAG TPA: hypothetical protein VEZ11_14990 [Thermoanaerobaculia bacterium]|nr:hypothetical protein [Thermoanaerobaculia bacterium]